MKQFKILPARVTFDKFVPPRIETAHQRAIRQQAAHWSMWFSKNPKFEG